MFELVGHSKRPHFGTSSARVSFTAETRGGTRADLTSEVVRRTRTILRVTSGTVLVASDRSVRRDALCSVRSVLAPFVDSVRAQETPSHVLVASVGQAP